MSCCGWWQWHAGRVCVVYHCEMFEKKALLFVARKHPIKSTCLFLFLVHTPCLFCPVFWSAWSCYFCKVNYRLFNFSNKTIWQSLRRIIYARGAPNTFRCGINSFALYSTEEVEASPARDSDEDEEDALQCDDDGDGCDGEE